MSHGNLRRRILRVWPYATGDAGAAPQQLTLAFRSADDNNSPPQEGAVKKRRIVFRSTTS